MTRKSKIAKLRKAGWRVCRGSYVGTCDDRLDRWYTDAPDKDYLDRRGGGFTSRTAAWDAIIEFVDHAEDTI